MVGGSLEPILDLFPTQEALPRKNEGIDEIEQPPAMLKFAGLTFHGDAIVAVGPDGTNVGAHTATGHHVDLDPVFLQNLDDTDMRQAASAAGGQSQTDTSVADFAGQLFRFRT